MTTRALHAALRVCAEGNYDAGNRRFDRHLVDHPRDLFALQFAHLGDLVVGRTTMLRDRIARVLGRWSERDAGYGYLVCGWPDGGDALVERFAAEVMSDLAD